MTTEAPRTDIDILDRLRALLDRGVDAPTDAVLVAAVAEIERLCQRDYWDGFDAALTAVEEGQPLYGTTRKAIAALRVVSRLGREMQHDEAVSGS